MVSRRWFEHVKRMGKESWVKCRQIVVERHRGEVDGEILGDRRVLNIQSDLAQETVKWRIVIK